MNEAVILEAGRLQVADPSSGRPDAKVGESRPSYHVSASAEQPAAKPRAEDKDAYEEAAEEAAQEQHETHVQLGH